MAVIGQEFRVTADAVALFRLCKLERFGDVLIFRASIIPGLEEGMVAELKVAGVDPLGML